MGWQALVALVCFALPWVMWWRFRDVDTDRDFGPYCYPAWHGIRPYQDTHRDAKPPLIHWLYKGWFKVAALFPGLPLKYRLRLPQFVGMSLTAGLVGWHYGPVPGLITSLLLSSPHLWNFFACTEWLTGLFVVCFLTLPAPVGYAALGLALITNQKNVLLLGLLALNWEPWCLPFLAAPLGVLLLSWREWRRMWHCVVMVVFAYARKRKVFVSTPWPILRNTAFELLPFAVCIDWTRWEAWALAGYVVVLFVSRQVLPHHFLLAVPFLALAVDPTPGMWLAYLIVWLFRSLPVWQMPRQVYDVVFSLHGFSYGKMLEDGLPVLNWLKQNVPEGEQIWINGFEHQIYYLSGRRTWWMDIPELDHPPQEGGPDVIVHCAVNAAPHDYTGYKPVFLSHLGCYTVMRRERECTSTNGQGKRFGGGLTGNLTTPRR